MSKENLLSVIVPVFQEQSVIEEFLSSLVDFMRSRFKRFEIIVVDDGSTDKTQQILVNMVEAHSELGVIVFSHYIFWCSCICTVSWSGRNCG